MKKYFIILALLICLPSQANLNDVYVADISYDWINKSEAEKEAMISEVKDIIFETPVQKKKDFKSLFKDRLKDRHHMENYYAASAGYEEFRGNKLSAFYMGKQKHIYMYALQDKTDPMRAYYYDALGNLKYVDFINGDYPDYPYYTIQYRISGTPVSAIYSISKDCQYLFKPSGEFEGVWYKHNLYNKKNKIILKRTTY